jgi:UDP-glucose 4-epimerase
MKKVAVSGGSGFIGNYVCRELISKGYTPIIFDHHAKDAKDYPDGCEFFLGDVTDPTAFTEVAAHADAIIHLAAVLGTQETVQNPRPAAQSNLMGGLNFLEACTQYNLPGVYIAVGNWWMNNSYSISKNMVERFVHMYNKERGSKVNIVRAVNAYGPRQLAAQPFANGKVRKITPALVCRAISGMPMELYGGGSQISDMVYVEDVATALVLALECADRDKVFDYAIEIGSVEHTTVREVAERINDFMPNYGLEKVEIVSLPMRPGEKEGDKVTADTTTLDKIGFDVNNLIDLDEGLGRTISYFIKNKGRTWQVPSL